MNLTESVKTHEGFSRTPYIDILVKLHPERYNIPKEDMEIIKKHFNKLKVTFGYGFTFITEEEAEKVLELRLQKRKKALFYKLPWLLNKPKEVINIVTEMAYQIGVRGLLKFKNTLNLIKEDKYKEAAIEMLDSRWAKQTPDRAKELSNKLANIPED